MSEDEAALELNSRCATMQNDIQDEIVISNKVSLFNGNPRVPFAYNVAH